VGLIRKGRALFVLLSILVVSTSAYEADPMQFVVTLDHEVFSQMGSAAVDETERKRRFAKLIDKYFDLDAIGKLQLGWRWSEATGEDRAEFSREFRAYLVQAFAARVHAVSDDHMTLIGVFGTGDAVIVSTLVATRERTGVPVGWRLVKTPVGWRLCDLIVNELSFDSMFRSQFDSVLKPSQADLKPLIRLLHEKAGE
jgi:phospholipid transport system substrate-binding protein